MHKIVSDSSVRRETPGGAFRFRHLTVEDGLPSNSVRKILQDRCGFIWFATEDGLVRFDGYALRVYRAEPGNPNSLGDRTIFAMLEDEQGYFWLGLSAKLDRFDPRTETFTHYALPGTAAFCLCRDRQGMIWIGTLDQGLYGFDPSAEMFTHHYAHTPAIPGSLSAHHVRCIIKDREGQLWVATQAGLDRLDRQSGQFVHYASGDPLEPLGQQINWLYQDTDSRFWVGTEGGLRCLDVLTGQFMMYGAAMPDLEPIPGPVTHICQDRSGRLWVATAGRGLSCVDLGKKQVTRFLSNPTDPDSLIDNGAWSVYADREENVWIGTINKGVDCLHTLKFTHCKHDPADPSSLRPAPVTAFCELNGEVWVANDDLYLLDHAGRPLTRYVSGTHELTFAAVCADDVGYIWSGGEATRNGLIRFDPRSEQTQIYRHDPDNLHSLSDDTVQVIYQDRQGQLWIGMERGLNWFDRVGERFQLYVPYPDNPTSMNNSIQLIYQDRAGDLWMGGWRGGLIRASVDRTTSPPTISFRHYLAREDDPTSLSGRSVLSILQDQDGKLWIGTANALDCFDPVTETFVHYTEADGLPSSVIRGILQDDDGRLWISTMNGLSCFDVEAGSFRNYTAADGLQSNQFMYGACFKSSNGDLYFGGVTGFNIFNSKNVQDNLCIPPIALTEMLLFNKPVSVGGDLLPAGIWAADQVVLGPEDYVFAFEFAALSYQAPTRNSYRYKMEGFDPDWNHVDSKRRFASYSNLPAGEYLFRVIGSNNDGIWNEQGVSLKVIVTQPLWQKLLAEKEAAEAANQAKSQFLANISHELRTPLTAILGFTELMLGDEQLMPRQRENLNIIYRSSEHLLGLINDVLDMARIEAGKTTLNPQIFDLHEMLLGLGEMFSLRAEQKKLTLVVDLASDVPQYIDADLSKLRQVLINLLGNAVKFTERGSIILRVTGRQGIREEGIRKEGVKEIAPVSLSPLPPLSTLSLSTLFFEIEDTGIGIAPEELEQVFEPFVQTASGRQLGQGTGLGLPISREYVRLMGGDIAVESTAGQGSCFRFYIQVRLPSRERETLAETVSRHVVGLEAGQQAPDGGCFCLLVVEDVQATRDLLVELLSLPGLEVRQAANGEQAIEIWETWHPCLIWMDMHMAVLDGYQATRRIKATLQGQQTVIIGMSASTFEHEHAEILAAGCDDFLPKPFSASQVFDILSRHLGIRFMYQKNLPDIQAVPTWTDDTIESHYRPASLPVEWVSAMRQAATVGDMQQMLTLLSRLDQIGGDPQLIDWLTRLVHGFEHDRILRWLNHRDESQEHTDGG